MPFPLSLLAGADLGSWYSLLHAAAFSGRLATLRLALLVVPEVMMHAIVPLLSAAQGGLVGRARAGAQGQGRGLEMVHLVHQGRAAAGTAARPRPAVR